MISAGARKNSTTFEQRQARKRAELRRSITSYMLDLGVTELIALNAYAYALARRPRIGGPAGSDSTFVREPDEPP